ncbi:MAG TPA: class I SAM-dependent methyltransferase [Thermoanaerobaculia bacterium]|nr:class I SAM-dependent methyltransferase [Thermoanaerobaculia bacterium]
MTQGDQATAEAFATSWNTVGSGSVYTREQFLDWMAPLDPADFAGRDVLELGFGNGSLLLHMGSFAPRRLAGIELGDTIDATRRNLAHLPAGMLDLRRGDLTRADLGTFDLVYCIGVLQHLGEPRAGFDAVLRHTKPGGAFHCWVYACEGNAVIRWIVDPVRRIASRLPWWLTKYAIALPLVIPYFLYAKLIAAIGRTAARGLLRRLPLYDYSLWIAKREFRFFHHVAFDQLVTPRTAYFPRATIDDWLRDPAVDPATTYVIFRNGNSWKFGGRRMG